MKITQHNCISIIKNDWIMDLFDDTLNNKQFIK